MIIMLMGIKGSAFKTHVKTSTAAGPALRFEFQPLDPGKPIGCVVISINKRDAHFLGEPDILIFAYFIFFPGMDIGVIEKNCKIDARSRQRLHQFSGTWS